MMEWPDRRARKRSESTFLDVRGHEAQKKMEKTEGDGKQNSLCQEQLEEE